MSENIQEIIAILKDHAKNNRLSDESTVKDLLKEVAELRNTVHEMRMQMTELKVKLGLYISALSIGAAIFLDFLRDKIGG